MRMNTCGIIGESFCECNYAGFKNLLHKYDYPKINQGTGFLLSLCLFFIATDQKSFARCGTMSSITIKEVFRQMS